jgi:hypothetical protein
VTKTLGIKILAQKLSVKRRALAAQLLGSLSFNELPFPSSRRVINITTRNALKTGRMTDFCEAHCLPLRLSFWYFSIIPLSKNLGKWAKSKRTTIINISHHCQ